MSTEPLKAGDWVMVDHRFSVYDRESWRPERIGSVTKTGRLRIGDYLYKDTGDGLLWRASILNKLRRATPEEVIKAEEAEAWEQAATEAERVKTERARAWLAKYDWSKAPAWMPTDIATRLGWEDK